MNTTERHAIAAECQAIVTAFAVHADLGELEKCAALFTSDGVFERKGEALVGPAAILRALQERPAFLRARHHCLPPHLDIVDGDNVKGITYFAIYRHYGKAAIEGPAPMAGPGVVGEFHDQFVRTAQGWRLKSRITHVEFRSVAE